MKSFWGSFALSVALPVVLLAAFGGFLKGGPEFTYFGLEAFGLVMFVFLFFLVAAAF